MTLIIALIAFSIERFFHWSHLRQWRWLDYYQRLLSQRISGWPSWSLLLICVLPPVLLVGIINQLLASWSYGMFQLIFGIIILVYCLGPYNLWVQAYSCLSELNKEDPKLAVERAQNTFGIGMPANSQAFHYALTRGILIKANESIFAVTFWFILLGPAGAVLYRTIALCANKSDLGLMPLAGKVQAILDWVPVRLFTLLFALGGHFVEVFQVWKKNVLTHWTDNDKLLTDCGIAALAVPEGSFPEDGSAEKATLDLLDRVFVISLVILAMFVLILK